MSRLKRWRPEALAGRGQHLLGVFDLGRRRKILPDQLAPLREILRATEIDGVVFKGLPFDHETIALWLLDRAMQLKSVKTLGTAKGCSRLGDRRFKVLLGAGLDVDLCDFGDHLGAAF